MKPGRILYIINHVDWFWSHRLPLAKAAKEQGWDVHVAVHGARRDPRFAAHGFTPHELPASPLGTMYGIHKVIGEVKPALLHAITLKYAFLAGLALLLHPHTKRVFTIAGLGYLFSGDGLKPKLLRIFISPLFKFVLRNAAIIVQNPDDRSILIKNRLIKDATLIRGSGVDTRQYRPQPDKEQTPPIVLMPTRLVRDKGVVVFIEAARILKAKGINARFQVAGGMEGDNPNTISKSEMESLVADGATEWLGRVNDMPALYATAAIVAYPSWYREGVPKVLLEAAASGKAIVTTDHPGCREVVVSGENGYLVPVKNAQATANAIEKILNDPALRERMGAAGRQKALNEFDVAHVVAQTLGVYSRI